VITSNSQEINTTANEKDAVTTTVTTYVPVIVVEKSKSADNKQTKTFTNSSVISTVTSMQSNAVMTIEGTIYMESPSPYTTISQKQAFSNEVVYKEVCVDDDDENCDNEDEYYEEYEDDEGNERMLSFEEWRKLNLQKSGQNDYTDRDPIQQRDSSSSSHDINNVIGDELEIDPSLFSGSLDYNPTAAHTPNSNKPNSHVNDNTGRDTNLESTNGKNNKNYNNNDPQLPAVDDSKAAGKFYKDRFNYASFDCAATIIKTNKEAKGAHNILIENKDSYMLNKCDAPNKFVIIELCQDILVDTVVIGSFEFFSSMFKDIRISVSDRFPPSRDDEWKVLGEFQGKSIRDFQSFHIKNPFIWARYLRLEFLSHWGQEFYCPVSIVRVYGTTMMEEYKSHGVSKAQVTASGGLNNSVKHDKTIKKDSEKLNHRHPISGASAPESDNSADNVKRTEVDQETDDSAGTIFSTSTIGDDRSSGRGNSSRSDGESIHADSTKSSTNRGSGGTNLNETAVKQHPDNDASPQPPSTYQCGELEFIGNLSDKILFDSKPDFCQPINKTSITSSSSKKRKAQSAPSLPPPPLPPPPPPQEPTTQESIYQTIMKRILLLESNATLSMQYIESQTQTLLERLLRVDRKYSAKIDNYLVELNDNIRKHYKHIRDQHQLLQELVGLQAANASTRLADVEAQLTEALSDLRYQKKVGIVQACLLLVILCFVVATRGAAIDIAPVYSSSSTGNHQHHVFKRSHRRGQKSSQSVGGSSSRHQLYHMRSLPLLRPASYPSSYYYGSGDDEFGSGGGGSTNFDTSAVVDASFDEDEGSPVPHPHSNITPYEYEKVYYDDTQQQSAYDNIPSPATSP
jgi:hypothetical protein